MNVIDKNIETEIIVNKSRFITNLFYVETEDEAKEKLNIIKKKYFDARHNCFAYILGLDGDKKKQSDDGEPSGTAGIPILMSLQNKNITNCIAITTRYFGGVLLGTGGLYKAYSDSSEKSIDSINLISVKQGFLIDMYIDYKNFDLLMKYLSDDKGFIIEKKFEENIYIKILIDEKYFTNIKKDVFDVYDLKNDIIDKKNYIVNENKIKFIN